MAEPARAGPFRRQHDRDAGRAQGGVDLRLAQHRIADRFVMRGIAGLARGARRVAVQTILRDEPRLARGERFDGHKIVFRKEREERRARE
jgi:hypothetical protein